MGLDIVDPAVFRGAAVVRDGHQSQPDAGKPARGNHRGDEAHGDDHQHLGRNQAGRPGPRAENQVDRKDNEEDAEKGNGQVGDIDRRCIRSRAGVRDPAAGHG